MKKTTNWTLSLILILVLVASLPIDSFARRKVINDEVTYDSGAIVNVLGTLKLDGTAVTSSAPELNILDGVTATASEINASADASARATTTSLTNTATLTLSASTPLIGLRGIGGADNATNTASLALPYPVGVEFTLYVDADSTNLIKIADGTNVVALGADWIGDATDVLKIYTVSTNSAVKVSSSDN